MEESVALDSSKQKDFVKSVKGLKKLIKKQKAKGKEPIKNESKPVKDGKVKKRRSRGLVYLSHIPHGFYENEMSQYFRQFGLVTNVRVIRSERTGNSKGYAFVEFKDTTVAQVVAETMNNYLMGKRLIKAVYIPPNKQKIHAKRKHWTFENNPTVIRRQKQKKAINAPKSLEKDLQAAKNMLKNLTKTKKKLKEIGIDYDFFKPVDIPEGLSYNQDSSDTTKDIKEVNKEVKKEDSKNSVDKKKVKVTPKTAEKKNNLEVKNDSQKAKKQKTDMQNKKGENVKTIEKKDVKTEKGKVNIEHKSHDETQKNKKQKLKDSNVKPLEDFIGIQESDGDSDGSLEFNSDEFEKSMDGEDSFGSEDDDSSDDNDLSDDGSDESAENVKLPVVLNPKKQQKVTEKVPQQQISKKVVKNDKQQTSKKVVKNDKQQTKSIVAPKSKADQKPIPSKKAKFEKQNNKKTLNKVIKKKK